MKIELTEIHLLAEVWVNYFLTYETKKTAGWPKTPKYMLIYCITDEDIFFKVLSDDRVTLRHDRICNDSNALWLLKSMTTEDEVW